MPVKKRKRKVQTAPKQKRRRRVSKVHPLKKYFPNRWKQFEQALSKKDSTRGKIYTRTIRRLVAWRISYPEKEMPDACVHWTEKDFRIWAGQEQQSKEAEEIDLDSIEDSLLTCPKCHMRKVDHFGKQTRSADEPETIFAHCLACDHRWRQ